MNSDSLKLLTFDKAAFGYKVEEVNNCINEIVKYLNFLEKENNSLKNDITALQDKNKELEATQDGIKELLVSAQKFSNNMIKEAKDKSYLIIKEANEKAESIISEAMNNSDKIIKENQIKIARETAQLKAIQKEVSDFKSQLLSSYKAHLDLITKLPSFDDKTTRKDELYTTKQSDSLQKQTEPSKDVQETFDFEQKPKEEYKEFPGFTNKEMNKSSSNSETSSFKITFKDNKESVANINPEKESTENNFKSQLLSSYKAHLDLITKLPSFDDKTTRKDELYTTKQSDSLQKQTEPNKDVKETFDFEQKPKEEYKEFSGFTNKEMNKPSSNSETSSFKITFKDNKESVANINPEKESTKNNFKSRFGELKFGEN